MSSIVATFPWRRSLCWTPKKEKPLLIAVGMGGEREPLPQLLRASGWSMFYIPFYYRIVRPVAFLHNLMVLRRSALAQGANEWAGRQRAWLSGRQGDARGCQPQHCAGRRA